MILLITLGPYVLVWSIIVALSLVFIKRALYKTAVIVFFSIGIWLFLFWDTIPARIEFNKLCEKDAGIHVYKTIEIDSEYFGVEGLNIKKLESDNVFSVENKGKQRVSQKWNIGLSHWVYYFNDIKVAEYKNYFLGRGKFLSGLTGGTSCRKSRFSKELLESVFKEKKNA